MLVLVGLMAAAGATFFAHGKSPEELGPILNPAAQAVLWVEAPLERALNRAVFFGIDAWKEYLSLRGVRADNQALRQRLFALESDSITRQALSAENGRLRDLLHFAEAQPLRTVAAPVIGDSLAPGAVARMVRIGAGEGDGVRRGMAVLSTRGAVGRVAQVERNFAEVQLLQDPTSSVAVRDERSRARANVFGTGRDRRAKLEYALRSDDIEEGDALITSGTDGVFPAGVPVGQVVEVQRNSSATFLRAQVIPVVDPRGLEEVLVVLSADLDSEPKAQK